MMVHFCGKKLKGREYTDLQSMSDFLSLARESRRPARFEFDQFQRSRVHVEVELVDDSINEDFGSRQRPSPRF